VRQSQRTIAGRQGVARTRVQADHVEIAAGKRKRQRRTDRTRADDDDVVQHALERLVENV
jgi:hypothetical protein